MDRHIFQSYPHCKACYNQTLALALAIHKYCCRNIVMNTAFLHIFHILKSPP